MVPRFPLSILSIAMLVTTICAPVAWAQSVAQGAPGDGVRVAAVRGGQLSGTVRDQDGAVLTGVSVLASGTTSLTAVTDTRGRFALTLPVGAYVVRAARSGYVASSRDVVLVESARRLERTITLVRAADADTAAADRAGDDPPGHSEIAWRLRHLPRTVLRDVHTVAFAGDGDRPPRSTVASASMFVAARAATAFFANTDFTGQVNLLATSALSRGVDTATIAMPDGWSPGVATLIIGAPVGDAGDWSVRGAVAASGMPAWTLLGEYHARDDRAHALRLGVSYSTQGFSNDRPTALPAAVPASRSAGSARVSDRWIVNRVVDVDYDVNVDHYDYLTPSTVFSPRVGARARVWDGVYAFASSARRTIAPGADQFLPSSASGPWLPPTRTFSALPGTKSSAPNSGLNVELVRNDRAGVEYVFGAQRDASPALTALPSIKVEWFSQPTTNQLATMFAIDETSQAGHYYLATVGNVDVVGWRVQAGGRLVEHVSAAIAYSAASARWTGTRSAWLLRRTVPELARRGAEQIANVQTTVDVDVPRTSTAVLFDYRMSVTDQTDDTRRFAPLGGGRFNLEVRQRLPFQPLDTGVLNLLVTLRTLLHDDPNGSVYDELLTLRPPTRFTGGVQLRF